MDGGNCAFCNDDDSGDDIISQYGMHGAFFVLSSKTHIFILMINYISVLLPKSFISSDNENDNLMIIAPGLNCFKRLTKF